jgi:DNA-binding NtrC family response regulator
MESFMKQTLLIADGDAGLCDLYRQFLTKRGFEVETSSNGLDCLRKLCQVKPAMLVLDLELRWGGGDGILAWLRQENPAHGIPVILTARAGFPQAFVSFIEPPVVDYLPKPFALTALLEKVRSAFAIKIPQEPSYRHRVSPEFFIG